MQATEKERQEEKEREEEAEKEKDGEIFVIEGDLSAQTLETYSLICEFFSETYRSSWTQRSIISKYLQENGHGDVNNINARLEHLIAKGKKTVQKNGLVFKKNGGRWMVKKI